MDTKTEKAVRDFARDYVSHLSAVEKLITIVEKAIKIEREACAGVCDESAYQWRGFPGGRDRELEARTLANSIRERGKAE